MLVTNDDGIESEGIRRLAIAAVAAGLDVTVAAPDKEASGSSAALSAVESEGRILTEPRALEGLEGVPCYAVSAAPAFAVLLAYRGAFGERPDVVLSGINRGANTGNAIVHSGTVGATLSAGTYGLPGLAVSLKLAREGAPQQWDTAATIAQRIIPLLVDSKDATVLNLNVPDLALSDVRGIKRAHLASFGAVQTNVQEVGKGWVKLGLVETKDELEPGSDAALLAAGYATVTPLNPICEQLHADVPGLDEVLQRELSSPR
ncbi:MAG: 5'/3'-nucleotidase SurE [Candidatus Dormibacteria bacterium]